MLQNLLKVFQPFSRLAAHLAMNFYIILSWPFLAKIHRLVVI